MDKKKKFEFKPEYTIEAYIARRMAKTLDDICRKVQERS